MNDYTKGQIIALLATVGASIDAIIELLKESEESEERIGKIEIKDISEELIEELKKVLS